MSRIILAPAAEADAVEIWTYIAKDNSTAGDHLLTRFNELFLRVSEQPRLGRVVENLDIPNLRLLPLGSYLIFFDHFKTA